MTLVRPHVWRTRVTRPPVSELGEGRPIPEQASPREGQARRLSLDRVRAVFRTSLRLWSLPKPKCSLCLIAGIRYAVP